MAHVQLRRLELVPRKTVGTHRRAFSTYFEYSSCGYQSVPRPSGVLSRMVHSGMKSGAPRGPWPGSAVFAPISPAQKVTAVGVLREHQSIDRTTMPQTGRLPFRRVFTVRSSIVRQGCRNPPVRTRRKGDATPRRWRMIRQRPRLLHRVSAALETRGTSLAEGCLLLLRSRLLLLLSLLRRSRVLPTALRACGHRTGRCARTRVAADDLAHDRATCRPTNASARRCAGRSRRRCRRLLFWRRFRRVESGLLNCPRIAGRFIAFLLLR
jgi:hypothetical protein